MRVHISTVLITMLLLFVLVILHLSTRRQIPWGASKEEIIEERTRTRFPFSFPQPFGSTNHHYTEDQIKDNNKVSTGFHAVSHSSTPGGPNPLHN